MKGPMSDTRRWLDELARHTGQPGANEVDRALTIDDRQGTIGGPDALRAQL
jgi:hypothetical protein